MYKSPIDVMMADIQHQIAQQQDEEIYKAVVSVGINVDKEELIRALRDDRRQYEEGYRDGRLSAMEEIVRCRECRYWRDGVEGCTDHVKCCAIGFYMIDENGYCSLGKRREGE